jgi:hypothetical protein
MHIILDIKNADDKMIKALRGVLKLYPSVKVAVKKEKGGAVARAVKQIKNGEYEIYSDFESYKKAMNDL